MNVIKILWQLPQSIVALLVYWFLSINKSKNIVIYSKELPMVWIIDGKYGGVSLGPFIFISCPKYCKIADIDQTLEHEKGHSKQSAILGPLYLILIGIPSITMWIISAISARYGKGIFYSNYYRRWPENWADKLAGVKRK